MQAIKEGIAIVWNILMSINVMDVIDIAIIAFIFYRLLTFARKTSVGGLVKGIVIIICVLWISDLLDLTMINYLLEHTVQMGVIALIVLFQPEIRKFLATVGSSKISIFFKKRKNFPLLRRLSITPLPPVLRCPRQKPVLSSFSKTTYT